MNGIEEPIIARAQYLLQEQARGKDLVGLCSGIDQDVSEEVLSAVRMHVTITCHHTYNAKEQVARDLLMLDFSDGEVDLSQWLSSVLEQAESETNPQISVQTCEESGSTSLSLSGFR